MTPLANLSPAYRQAIFNVVGIAPGETFKYGAVMLRNCEHGLEILPSTMGDDETALWITLWALQRYGEINRKTLKFNPVSRKAEPVLDSKIVPSVETEQGLIQVMEFAKRLTDFVAKLTSTENHIGAALRRLFDGFFTATKVQL